VLLKCIRCALVGTIKKWYHISSSSDPVIISTLVEYVRVVTGQSCGVRTVFLCCNAFIYNYNQSDVKSVLLQITNAGTEMLEVDTCLKAKNQQLFGACCHLHFCAHMIPSYVSEWHVLPYGLDCPVQIWTSLQKSSNSLSQLLCCNLIHHTLPSLLKLFQACKQCAAVGQTPDVSNTHHHPRSSSADHNPLSCHQVQQTQQNFQLLPTSFGIQYSLNILSFNAI